MLVEATKMTSNLFMGPYTIPELACGAGFDVLVLCALEHQPVRPRGATIRVIHSPMDDHHITPQEWRMAVHTARVVAAECRQGRRVLVTCMAGRNRSGLVTALAWKILEPNVPMANIVRVIRSRRMHALTNDSFVAALIHSEAEMIERATAVLAEAP